MTVRTNDVPVHGKVHLNDLMILELNQRVLGEKSEVTYRNLCLPRADAGNRIRAVDSGTCRTSSGDAHCGSRQGRVRI